MERTVPTIAVLKYAAGDLTTKAVHYGLLLAAVYLAAKRVLED